MDVINTFSTTSTRFNPYFGSIVKISSNFVNSICVKHVLHINLLCFFLAITVMFNDTMYSVNENAGPAQPVLVLSNPSSMEFNVTVFNTDGSATGGSTIGEYCSILINY